MINLKNVKKYCKDYTNIENYYKAIEDNTETWHCHHKKEIELNKTRKELVDMGLYYDVKPEDLIFIKLTEHIILHNKGSKRSTEIKEKMSKAQKIKHQKDKYLLTKI